MGRLAPVSQNQPAGGNVPERCAPGSQYWEAVDAANNGDACAISGTFARAPEYLIAVGKPNPDGMHAPSHGPDGTIAARLIALGGFEPGWGWA